MHIKSRVATAADAPAIAGLLDANAAANGGALYGDWSLPVVQRWLDSGVTVVVVTDGPTLAGVLFTDSPHATTAPPVLAALKVWPAKPGAYIYGPVCVSQDYRGQGIFELLLDRLSLVMAGREGILFINKDNERSLRAHARLGMTEQAAFELDGKPFAVLTFNGCS